MFVYFNQPYFKISIADWNYFTAFSQWATVMYVSNFKKTTTQTWLKICMKKYQSGII